MKDSKRNNVVAITVIAVLVGLYLVLIAPGFFDETMSTLILKQSKQGTQLTAGPISRLYIGSLYSGVEILIGLALIALALPLYRRQEWAWPATLALLSVPVMANAYVGLGWLENLKQFPPAYVTFFLCLIAFWAVLLLRDSAGKSKGILFWILTLLGMLGAQGFMLFPHAVRVILKDPASSLKDPAVAVLLRTGPLMFLIFIFSVLAIWRIAQNKRIGWYLALLTALMTVVGSFPAHYARPLVASLVPSGTLPASIFTSTYWMAGAQGVLLVILLLLPAVRAQLLEKPEG